MSVMDGIRVGIGLLIAYGTVMAVSFLAVVVFMLAVNIFGWIRHRE